MSDDDSDACQWREVTDSTYRLRVPGGWLYRYELFESISDEGPYDFKGVAMCFVPLTDEAR
jgi:hypothetical protein